MGLLKRSNEIIGMKIHVPVCVFSCVQLFATPWAVTHQVPLSMRFSRQEYWNELPFPSPGDLPNSGIESVFSPLSHVCKYIVYYSLLAKIKVNHIIIFLN